MSVTVPTRLVAPGPGRFAFAFTSGLVVLATQNTDASVTAFGVPIVNPPTPAAPVSRISVTIAPARTHEPPVPQSVDATQPLPSFVPPWQ
jgi:hypothetical protein